jgi:rhodanese-related sulfurtransferase
VLGLSRLEKTLTCGWDMYAGELTAPQALDLLSQEDYILIDVRSEKDKAKSGIPSLPRNAKNKFLPVP